MRFIALALIALVALTTVRADLNANTLTCIANIGDPCNGDSTCKSALGTYNSCLGNNNCKSKSTASDVVNCVTPCIPSNNAAVEGYAKEQIACVNVSAVLSFAGLLLAIFTFAF